MYITLDRLNDGGVCPPNLSLSFLPLGWRRKLQCPEANVVPQGLGDKSWNRVVMVVSYSFRPCIRAMNAMSKRLSTSQGFIVKKEALVSIFDLSLCPVCIYRWLLIGWPVTWLPSTMGTAISQSNTGPVNQQKQAQPVGRGQANEKRALTAWMRIPSSSHCVSNASTQRTNTWDRARPRRADGSSAQHCKVPRLCQTPMQAWGDTLCGHAVLATSATMHIIWCKHSQHRAHSITQGLWRRNHTESLHHLSGSVFICLDTPNNMLYSYFISMLSSSNWVFNLLPALKS